MHVEFTEKNSASGSKPAYEFGIFSWNAILEQAAARGSANISRINQILQSDRDSMQRAAPLPVEDFLFSVSGLR